MKFQPLKFQPWKFQPWKFQLMRFQLMRDLTSGCKRGRLMIVPAFRSDEPAVPWWAYPVTAQARWL